MTFYIILLTFLALNDFIFLDISAVLLFYVIYIFIYILSKNYMVLVFNVKCRFLKVILTLQTFVLLFKNKFKTLFSLNVTSKIKWKPLFKKSSYFGLYRSNKNQQLNK